MSTITKGVAVVYGIRPSHPITALKDGVLRRVVMRNDHLTHAVYRFQDRVEVWTLEDCGSYWQPLTCLRSVRIATE